MGYSTEVQYRITGKFGDLAQFTKDCQIKNRQIGRHNVIATEATPETPN